MRKFRWWMPVVLATMCIVAYHNTFHAPFIFDDFESIRYNPTIRRLWPIWDALSPSATKMVGGRPVINFSLALNYAVCGTSVPGYHALNLAIHILAALAVFGVVRRTMLQPVLNDRFRAVASGLALATAIVWAVHPIQTEAVTYVSQRAESLMGLFYLLTLYCFIRGIASPKARLWFILSIVACLLGMATKEVMVTAPLMVLLYDRTFVAGSFRAAWTQRWRLYMGLGGTWLVLGYLMAGIQYRGAGYGLGVTWQAYALTECQVVVNYLWLALWPHPLTFDYGTDMIIRHAAEAVPYALILMLLAAGAVVALKRWPAIGFTGAWFFVILAPTSSVVPVAYQPMAENRIYLPLLAVITMVLGGGDHLCRNLWARFGWPDRLRVWLQAGIAMGLAFALGIATIQRNAQYRTAESIWADVVTKRPGSARGHANLGFALLDDGRATESIPHFLDALRIDPGDPIVRCNLAAALVASGATNQAASELEGTLRNTPDWAPAHAALADILANRGEWKAAQEHYAAALAIDPNEETARFNLAQLLTRMGQREGAITQYTEVLRLDPRNATAHYNLANLLAENGRESEAISHYSAAARFDPGKARSHINLGNLFLKQGRLDDAIRAYTDALHADPNAFKAHNNLAVILVSRGDLVGATAHFREAARLEPDAPEVHSELADVLERQGLHAEAQRQLAEARRLQPATAAH